MTQFLKNVMKEIVLELYWLMTHHAMALTENVWILYFCETNCHRTLALEAKIAIKLNIVNQYGGFSTFIYVFIHVELILAWAATPLPTLMKCERPTGWLLDSSHIYRSSAHSPHPP